MSAADTNGDIGSLDPGVNVVDGQDEHQSSVPASQNSELPGAIPPFDSTSIVAVATTTRLDGTPTTEAIIGGTTLVEGGSAATISGHTVSFASGSLVLDGTEIAISALSSPPPVQPEVSAVLESSSSTFTVERPTITASDGKTTIEAIVEGKTLIEGGSAVTIDGHIVFLKSNDIVVDGTLTVQMSSLPTPSQSYLVTLDSDVLTGTGTAVVGSAGCTTTEVILDGSTLLLYGPAVTISGHTLSLAASGLVQDGTQVDPFTTKHDRPTATATSTAATSTPRASQLAASATTRISASFRISGCRVYILLGCMVVAFLT